MGFTAEDTALKGALTDCNIDIEKGTGNKKIIFLVLLYQFLAAISIPQTF